ncbi:hypothetical protein [Nioella aestuarii]|uniref:hypothetical protein n=1 Tax=Nioella aestuarii TaxID=1662864 RepID=UPI003D7F30AE
MSTKPEDFSDRANALLQAKNFSDALQTAELGLLDHPAHLGLGLVKINALRKLDRIEDAIEFAESLPLQGRADWLTRPIVSLLSVVR